MGTITEMLLVLAAVTTALTGPKYTILEAATGLKLRPVIVTVLPIGAE